MPLGNVGTRDRDDHLKWERYHWQKYHYCTKSYHVTPVENNHCCMISHRDAHNEI